jgi:ABC-type xylose transport system substrate-binding protein
MLSPTVVDKENMDATIIKDGFHIKEDVYGY